MEKLKNKVAVVTGGSSGIGEAISEVFLDNGAIVYVLDVQEQNDSDANYIQCDVSDQGDTQKAMDQVFTNEGKIDILINNAGISHIGTAENTTESDFDRIYRVNVKGVYNCLHACIPFMKKSGGGVIVNMSSVAALVALPDRFAYSMSKGAVTTMTYSVARDYINDNIRCNGIAPGRVHTPFVDGYLKKNYPGQEKEMYEKLAKTQPIGRMGEPREIAQLALYLCSDEASFITGSIYPIDGGFITLNT
ncbi:MAG: short-chain dehydrogenase [Bacteroides sp. SM23_62]|nr:MAG: short-chain dehydrogenase [Bacteroides sp. SM23_62]